MEEMKNLIIQSLETKGVLGQIRAKLRSSVFKIVDEQDQRVNMGCGLKWENPALYKISETKVGTLIAELIREFMEYFRMDYSLSIFIPECSISPERLRKEELLAKMGIKPSSLGNTGETPLIYFMTYYFIESLILNPDHVYESLNNIKNDVERQSDDLIENNMRNYFSNVQTGSQEEERESLREKVVEPQVQQTKNEFEVISQSEINKARRSNEFEERRERSSLRLDNSPKKEETKQPEKNIQLPISDNSIEEEIIGEEIVIEEDSFDKTNDKKAASSGTNGGAVSQSGGYDATVDSNVLESYNYIEQIDKPL